MGNVGRAGSGVTAEKPREAGSAEAKEPEPKRKPPEYRRFEQLLKKVVKAPPL
jgi:hypothetical protein